MTTTNAVLIAAKLAENAETTQYTSTSCVTLLDKITAYNKSGSTATIIVRIVNSGGTGGAGTAEYSSVTKSLLAGTDYSFPTLVGHTLASGDFISTLAGTASAIEIRASGRKIT